MPVSPFRIVVGPTESPIVAHAPHASPFVSEEARRHILLSDDELQREIVRLADWHTDHLFSWVTGVGGTEPLRSQVALPSQKCQQLHICRSEW